MGRTFAVIAGLAQACEGSAGDADPPSPGATPLPPVGAPGLGSTTAPDSLGALHMFALTARPDGSDEHTFSRNEDVGTAHPSAGVAALPMLLAALRTGAATLSDTTQCTARLCTTAHGTVSARDALGLGCRDGLATLAGRVGTDALGAAFASFGLEVPPLPEAPLDRVRLVVDGDGWSLTPRQALRIAGTLHTPPTPWPTGMTALITLRAAEAGPLAGAIRANTSDGWFLGFARSPEDRLVAAHASGCRDGCDHAALRLARWALDRTLAARGLLPPAPPPSLAAPPADAGTRSPSSGVERDRTRPGAPHATRGARTGPRRHAPPRRRPRTRHR